jgi:hypothetical protein
VIRPWRALRRRFHRHSHLVKKGIGDIWVCYGEVRRVTFYPEGRRQGIRITPEQLALLGRAVSAADAVAIIRASEREAAGAADRP